MVGGRCIWLVVGWSMVGGRLVGGFKKTLIDEENLSDYKEIAETFNNCFNKAVKFLDLQCDPEHLNDVSDENDPIKIALKKFQKSSQQCENK